MTICIFPPPDAKLQIVSAARDLHRVALLLDIAPLLEGGISKATDNRDNRDQYPHRVRQLAHTCLLFDSQRQSVVQIARVYLDRICTRLNLDMESEAN
jgi:hypothetical protein